MSIVIIGGNECMIPQYKKLCQEYDCDAKIFIYFRSGMKNQIGNPDLMVLFTNTLSHKMLQYALSETKGSKTIIERSHSSSKSALKAILEKHAA
ncbi:MAG: DUF2325 domain-containing protein [Oscillospiraceae bacterium]|nr:DUF2325 domain-containing protein [Oscillospiraceae bacterium]